MTMMELVSGRDDRRNAVVRLPTVATEEAQQVSKQEQREAHGQCPSCGQQLYRLKAIGSPGCLPGCLVAACFGIPSADGSHHPQPTKKIPLSIPQLVDRGQCMKCNTRPLTTPPYSDDASSGGTSELNDDDPANIFPHPVSSLPSMNGGIKVENKIGDAITKKTSASSISSTEESSNSAFVQEQATRKVQYYPSYYTSPQQRHKLTSGLSLSPTTTAIYNGQYNVYGQRHGEGELIWSNGDRYNGSFANNVRQGHGTLAFAPLQEGNPDGGEYVGDWHENQMHGSGTRRYPSGDIYMGGYETGKRQSEGRFYYANGDLYWGFWENNQMQGSGRYYYSSGQRFEGVFVRSRRNGMGKLQRTDGTLEIFQYIQDQRVGKGVRWSADRSRAWNLWMPTGNGRTGYGSGSIELEKQRISASEAVRIVNEIEQAAASYGEDLT